MDEQLIKKINQIVEAINKIGRKTFEYEEHYTYGSEVKITTDTDWEDILKLKKEESK